MMNMNKTTLTLTLLLAFVTIAGSAAEAQTRFGRPSRAEVGLKLGLISRMSMTGATEQQSSASISGQADINHPITGRYSFPLTIDFHRIAISRANQTMLVVSGGISRSISFPDSELSLRPGMQVGFGFLADIGDLPSSQYLTYKISVELLSRMDNKRSWVGELAFIDMPSGSMQGESIKFGFGILLRFGIAFS